MRKREKHSKEVKAKLNLTPLISAGIIALLLASGIYFLLINAEDKRLGGYDKQTVYIVNTDIAKGTLLQPSYFGTKIVDTGVVPEDAVKDISALQNYCAKYDISKGMIITDTMFENVDENIVGNREVAVNIADLKGAINGTLRQGDRVDIYIVSNDYSTKQDAYRNYRPVEEDEDAENIDLSNTTIIVDGEAVDTTDIETTEDSNVSDSEAEETDYIYEMNEDEDMDITENDNESDLYTMEILRIEPTWENVYIQRVFDSDGNEIVNGAEGLTSSFIITMNKDDVDYLIGALQSGRVYLSRNVQTEETDTVEEGTINE